VDLVPVAEFDFVLEALEVELVGWRDGRLTDWKDAAQRFRFGRVSRSGQAHDERSAGHGPQELAAGLSW
jgi:hypothetical protein